MDLEQIPPGELADRTPPGELGNDTSGDVWSRLKASHRRLQEKATEDFPMPHDGLILRCHKPGIDAYRTAAGVPEEWERWAQLLIDCCDGFYAEGHKDPLLDEFDQPVLWDTLADRLGLELDPELGVRGLVRDVFPAEADMIAFAQDVDAWINDTIADREAELAKGS